MNKIQKLIAGIKTLIAKPYYINKIIDDDDSWKERFIKKYPEYTSGLPVVDFHEITGSSEVELNYCSLLDGGSSALDYGLLKAMAAQKADCDYFEIGTWRGESAVNVAEVAKHCTTMNLDDKSLQNLGFSYDMIGQIGVYVLGNPKVTQLRVNSLEFDFASYGHKFDLIFIDGDHHYSSICSDTRNVFSYLMKSDSIVIWHDYTFYPDTVRWEVYQAILDSLPKEEHKHLYHVRNTNCAVYIHKNFITEKLRTPDFPKVNFKVRVETNPVVLEQK